MMTNQFDKLRARTAQSTSRRVKSINTSMVNGQGTATSMIEDMTGLSITNKGSVNIKRKLDFKTNL
jgi:hypothetical protein